MIFSRISVVHKPIINENDRKRIIESVKGVDRVEINRFRDKLKLWELYRFDVIFIGDDWKGTERWNNFEKVLAEINVIFFNHTISMHAYNQIFAVLFCRLYHI